MKNIINRFAAISGNAKESRPMQVVPLITSDGMLVTAGIRALPGPSLAAVVGALTRAGCYPRANQHGLRWMLADGSASPCFTERVGNVSGTVYLYGGSNKKVAFFSALEAAGLPCQVGVDCTWIDEKGNKTGGKYASATPLTDEQADKLVAILSGVAFTSTGGGNQAERHPMLGALVPVAPVQADSAVEAVEDSSKGSKGGKDSKADSNKRPAKRV